MWYGAQVTWKDALSNNAAWDTLTWFAALIGMASYLNKYGFIKWFSNQVSWRGDPTPKSPWHLRKSQKGLGFGSLLLTF
jgi:di/tricarboxylate transporter